MHACGSVDAVSSAGNAADMSSVDTLIDVIAERLRLGTDVAMTKFISGGHIDDSAREKEILDWVVGKLPDDSPVNEVVLAFFRDQIAANKVLQRGLHNYWRNHSAVYPGRKRDLAQEIRPQLDVINRRMLILLPSVPRLSREQLAAAADLLCHKLHEIAALQRLPDVRRAATEVALRSLGEDD